MGRSHSTRPISKRPPEWCSLSVEEVEALVIDLAKKGYSPSIIGLILRDQHGIPLVKPLVGKTIVEILRGAKILPKIPEDLQNLLNKAARLSRHLKKHKRDRVNVRSLQLLESKIHRMARYYKEKDILPLDWEYKFEIAKVI